MAHAQHEKDNGKLRLDLARCRYALGESVKLQSHYAQLLNRHDGGERIGFTDADEWIARVVAVCDHKFVDSRSCLKCGWTPSAPDTGARV